MDALDALVSLVDLTLVQRLPSSSSLDAHREIVQREGEESTLKAVVDREIQVMFDGLIVSGLAPLIDADGSEDGLPHRVIDLLTDANIRDSSDNSGGTVCAHPFSPGEPVFRCKTCGLDDTCVLCRPCFLASHESLPDHDTSFHLAQAAGGCCDCGDSEAFVTTICCSLHSPSIPNDHNTGNDNPKVECPSQIIAVLRTVIVKALDILIDSLLPSPIARESSISLSGTCALILWNDESHSFDEVIDAVMEAVGYSEDAAREVANIVDARVCLYFLLFLT